MADDVGYPGSFSPKIVGEGTLNECRNLMGEPQYEGQKWAMLDLETGKIKWYRSNRRRLSRRRRY